MNIKEILNKNIDNDYKKFHEKICHTNYEILGVKIPILRKIALNLLKEFKYQDIFKDLNDNYYEHIMFQGIVIANAKISYNERINLINNYLPKIDNWGICDIFCSELKFIKRYKDEFLKYVISFLNSDKEYYQRFGIVIMIDYYISDDYIDFILEKTLEIKSNYYYVKMAISWCLSICLIKYFDKTVNFMNNNKTKLDKWIYNKALQKAKESFRISKENKETLQNMKIK